MAKLSDYVNDLRETVACKWPGTEREVRILLLNCQEIQDAHFAAREHFLRKNQQVDLLNQGAFSTEIEYQLLLRMVLDPDDERPTARLFPGIDAVRRSLTPDMASHFFSAHGDLRDRRAREQGIVIDSGA